MNTNERKFKMQIVNGKNEFSTQGILLSETEYEQLEYNTSPAQRLNKKQPKRTAKSIIASGIFYAWLLIIFMVLFDFTGTVFLYTLAGIMILLWGGIFYLRAQGEDV